MELREIAAFLQVAHHTREAVQAVGIHAGQAVLREDYGGVLRVLRSKALFLQHAGKFFDHGFVCNSHVNCLFSVKFLFDQRIL